MEQIEIFWYACTPYVCHTLIIKLFLSLVLIVREHLIVLPKSDFSTFIIHKETGVLNVGY